MKKNIIQEVFIIVFLGHLLFVTDAFFFWRNSGICQNNENADPLIRGDSQNAVINFHQVIRNKNVFAVVGDTTRQTDGCRRDNGQHKHRKGRYHDGRIWIIDCWEPFECKMIEDGTLLKLLPASDSSSAPVQVRTILLPLDQHETSSYTFLPSITRDNVMFVTAMLSGCSVFILRPSSLSCNLIIIHTNYRCDEGPRNYDFNHHQAMTVLEEVQSTNPSCRYQVERRWAENDWRSVIHGYPYPTHFYDFEQGPSFLYGYHVGGTQGAWQICIKVVNPQNPVEFCYTV